LRSAGNRVLAGVGRGGIVDQVLHGRVAGPGVADAESIRRGAAVARGIAQPQVAFKSKRLDDESIVEVGEQNLRGLAVHRSRNGDITTGITVGAFIKIQRPGRVIDGAGDDEPRIVPGIGVESKRGCTSLSAETSKTALREDHQGNRSKNWATHIVPLVPFFVDLPSARLTHRDVTRRIRQSNDKK